jgi:hypothetical protein
MRHEFTYLIDGHTCQGLITYEDGQLGPIVVYPDSENAYTYLAGYSQAGSDALYVHQQVNSVVEFRHVKDQQVESLLREFIQEFLPPGGGLRSIITAMLSDYI